jgi:hypothetical protein
MYTAHADTDGTLLALANGKRRFSPFTRRNRASTALEIILSHIDYNEQDDTIGPDYILRTVRASIESETPEKSDSPSSNFPAGVTYVTRIARAIQKAELEELRKLEKPRGFVDVDSLYYSPSDQTYYTRTTEHEVSDSGSVHIRVSETYTPEIPPRKVAVGFAADDSALKAARTRQHEVTLMLRRANGYRYDAQSKGWVKVRSR